MRARLGRPAWTLVFLAAMVASTGCAAKVDREPATQPSFTTGPPVPADSWTLELVAEGFSQPLQVTHAGDGSGRIFVVEQVGRVYAVRDGSRSAQPFLDVRDLIQSGGERGLLSIAFAPDFKDSGRLYVSYTDKAGDSVLARYRVDATDPDRVDPASAQILLTVDQPYPNHNGGLALFGPDGHLYLGLGDGGSQNDPRGNGQNKGVLLGKLLRLDVNTDDASYGIPDANPFRGDASARPEVWAYGLRNPWRFSFDRDTGDLFIADVGQNTYEEIDVQPRNSHGGENYGWAAFEGNHRFGLTAAPRDAVFPVAEYSHAGGHCSVTGGHVYRGQEVPSFAGRYVFGDLCSGTLWTLVRDGALWSLAVLGDFNAKTGEPGKGDYQLSSFGEDEEGELYLAHLGGRIYRFGSP